ncbi:hypothetical protein CSKR_108920, partial [Clonorchis sinensis]
TIEQGRKTLICISFTKLNIHLLLERVFLNFSGYSLTVTQIQANATKRLHKFRNRSHFSRDAKRIYEKTCYSQASSVASTVTPVRSPISSATGGSEKRHPVRDCSPVSISTQEILVGFICEDCEKRCKSKTGLLAHHRVNVYESAGTIVVANTLCLILKQSLRVEDHQAICLFFPCWSSLTTVSKMIPLERISSDWKTIDRLPSNTAVPHKQGLIPNLIICLSVIQ